MLSAYQSEPYGYPAEVPRELAAIANRATHVDPARRFESAEAMRRALADYLEHRASYRLTEESNERLDALRDAIESDASSTSIYDLAGGCRFGFEEALSLWSANDDARAGRENVLREMVRYEIAHDNLVAAEAHLEAMDDPGDLRDDVDALRRKQAGRQAKLEELEALEREVDLNVGWAARRLGGLVLALVWGITPLLGVYLQEWGLFELNHDTYLTQAGSLIFFYALLVFAFRRVLLSNRVNRRIITGIFFTCLLLVGYRFYVINLGIPVRQAIGAELFIYGLGVAIVAFVSDLRLLLGSLIWSVGAIIISFDPARALEWMAVTNFVVPAYAAAIWWQGVPEGAGSDP
jgi:serine/threonine-protein kinase